MEKMSKIIRALFIVISLVAVLLIPIVVSSTYWRSILVIGFTYGIVASSWDLTLGYGGVFNFAQVATFGIGSYAAGIMAIHGVSPILSILLATGFGVLYNGFVALPVIRLRGVYVALITFAAAQIAGSVALGWTSVTGGGTGLVLVPDLTFGKFDFNMSPVGFVYLTEIALVVSLVVLRFIAHSPFGLSLIAGRDAEDYAIGRGVPVARNRVIALLIGAAFASFAGAIFTFYLQSASPTVFGFGTATLVLSMVLVGGAGSIIGPAVAAVLLTALQNMRQVASLGPVTFMIIAVLIILILRFLPGGLWDLTVRRLKVSVRKPSRS
jgi:branched-chain amino acid transport system permease protein